MPVITISRQYGSLGDEIAGEVADRMGLRLVDQGVIAEVAQALGLSSSYLQDRDEWSGTVVSDLVKTMRRLYPATIVPQATDAPPELDEASYLQVIRQVIWEVARSDDAVIIGRGAAFILEKNPTIMHVLIVAPLPIRIERVMVAEHVDRQRAEQQIKRVDERRGRYIRHFYQADWLDARHYDLVLNTGHFTQRSAAGLIVAAAAPESVVAPDA
jgi:cytidylate kinase